MLPYEQGAGNWILANVLSRVLVSLDSLFVDDEWHCNLATGTNEVSMFAFSASVDITVMINVNFIECYSSLYVLMNQHIKSYITITTFWANQIYYFISHLRYTITVEGPSSTCHYGVIGCNWRKRADFWNISIGRLPKLNLHWNIKIYSYIWFIKFSN